MQKSEQNVYPFFTFKGIALEAMTYYVNNLPGGKQLSLTHFEEGERGEVGKVMNATFEIMGLQIMVMDMEEQYSPEFSWATTLLLNCQSEAEFDQIFTALSKGGQIMMGPEAIGDLRKVSWVTDKFNVTWQIVWQ